MVAIEAGFRVDIMAIRYEERKIAGVASLAADKLYSPLVYRILYASSPIKQGQLPG